jgi:hypothetical protein
VESNVLERSNFGFCFFCHEIGHSPKFCAPRNPISAGEQGQQKQRGVSTSLAAFELRKVGRPTLHQILG